MELRGQAHLAAEREGGRVLVVEKLRAVIQDNSVDLFAAHPAADEVLAVKDLDFEAGLLQPPGRGQPGNPGPDHHRPLHAFFFWIKFGPS